MPQRPPNTNNTRSVELGAAHENHDHAHADLTSVTSDQHHTQSHAHDGVDGSGTVSHDDLTGVSADDHHNEAHTVASHSDTTATGAELETLTDGSDADSLHNHDHGNLAGLTDDDHTQYLNETRHDAIHLGSAVFATVDQSIPNTTVTDVEFDTVLSDVDSWFSNANDTITVPADGWYLCSAQVSFDPGAGNRRQVRITASSTGIVNIADVGNNSAFGIRVFASAPILLSASETLKVAAFQDSGGSLDTVSEAAGASTWFRVVRLA